MEDIDNGYSGARRPGNSMGVNREIISSMRYRGKSKRRLYDEDENLVTVSSKEFAQRSSLSASIRDVFRNITMVDLPVIQISRINNNQDIEIGLPGADSNEDEGETRENLKSYIKKVIEIEFPKNNNIPTARDVINVGTIHENKARYRPGTWVEIEGPDMKWRLDMITRVVRQAPDDWDWNDPKNEEIEPTWVFHYYAGIERKFCEEDVRSPEEGLKIVFGNRPWVWQQWAILKLEDKLRFQEGHQHDCMEMDVQKYAADLWDQWLEDTNNEEFYTLFYDERVGDRGRAELRRHIMKPFYLIDRMKEDKVEWDFHADNNLSVFTFMSLLGAGSLVPFVVFAMQIAIPIVLLLQAIKNEGCEDQEGDTKLSRIMVLIVYVLYMVTVIPDNFSRFHEVELVADTVYSRLLSLRRQLWVQGDDSIIQMIGYKVDILMSTAYEVLLSTLNIYVLLRTYDTIDVILNALAFVFIAQIDQEIVKSAWWDPKNRWITAGAIEVIMASTVRLNLMASPILFHKKYGIPLDLLEYACDTDVTLLLNSGVAIDDALDTDYMTNEERVLLIFREVAEETDNPNAMDEYEKPSIYFGVLETVMGRLGYAPPVFMNFKNYRTWSRWSKILFLSPVPNLNDIFETDACGNMVVSEHLNLITSTKGEPFANFYPDEDGISKTTMLFRHIREVLKSDLIRGVRNSLRSGQSYALLRVGFHFLDSFIQFFAYLCQILLPLYLSLAFFLTIYPLITQKCLQLF